MKYIVLLMTMLASLNINAIPSLKKWRTVTMADGSKQQVMLVGDENNNYYVTKSGEKVQKSGKIFKRISINQEFLNKTNANKALGRSVAKAKQMHAKQMAPAKQVTRNYRGSKRGLIILVQFADKKFSMADPQATYQAIANEVGYKSDYGTTGSIHDYFYDQSYGKFDLSFDVVGPVTLPKPYAYYGGNHTVNYYGDEYKFTDARVGEMIVEACKASDAEVNFADYDWDGNGEADQVFVLYAGQGEASSDNESTVWPHEYQLQYCASTETIDSIVSARKEAGLSDDDYNYDDCVFAANAKSMAPSRTTIDENSIYDYFIDYFNLKLDGVKVNTYACGNELFIDGENTPMLMGIGTICHEFAHCLGFPDVYDTAYSGNYGMGSWDLMDIGCYNGPYGLGWKPAGFTSYERNFAGWLDYQTLPDNTSITDMPALSEEGVAYKLTNPNHENEYYLYENRQHTGWDEYTPGEGLLVIHVDYDANIWARNEINTTAYGNTHQRMAICRIPGDAPLTRAAETTAGSDTYPYLHHTSITDLNAEKLYHANADGTYLLHYRMMDIAQNNDGTIGFNYNPDTTQATDIYLAELSNDKEISIYDLNGRKLSGITRTSDLQKGIYVVKYQSGKSKKIAIN